MIALLTTFLFLQTLCARWITLPTAHAKTVFGHLNNSESYRGVKHQRECNCSLVNGTLMVGYWSAHCTTTFYILSYHLFFIQVLKILRIFFICFKEIKLKTLRKDAGIFFFENLLRQRMKFAHFPLITFVQYCLRVWEKVWLYVWKLWWVQQD